MTEDRRPDGDRRVAATTAHRRAVPTPSSRRRARRHARWILFATVALTVVILDQLTKAWLVVDARPGRARSRSSATWLRLVHGQNSGALFGLFRDQAVLFGIVSLGVIGLIVAYHGRSGRNTYLTVALGLLLGGAIGNLLDRFRLGYVVDWIDIGIGDTAVLDVQRRRCRDQHGHRAAHRSRPLPGVRGQARAPGPMPDAVTVPGDARPCACRTGPRTGRPVRRRMTGLSRSYVQKLISDGRLTVRGHPLRANAIVTAGAELRLDVPEPVPLDLTPAPDIPLEVVYEDDDLLIVDKPAGLVVHPSPGHHAATPWSTRLLARAGGADTAGSPASRARASSTGSTATRAGC